MLLFQRSNQAIIKLIVLGLALDISCCTKSPQGHPVHTTAQASQITSQFLHSLGHDTSRYVVWVHPGHPISLDSIAIDTIPGRWLGDDYSFYPKSAVDKLTGKVFWMCYPILKSEGGLTTDPMQTMIYVDAGTGAVLLTRDVISPSIPLLGPKRLSHIDARGE